MVYHVLPGGRYMEMDPPSHRAVKLLGVVGGWILRGGNKSPCACVCVSTGRERLAELREAKTGGERACERASERGWKKAATRESVKLPLHRPPPTASPHL